MRFYINNEENSVLTVYAEQLPTYIYITGKTLNKRLLLGLEA